MEDTNLDLESIANLLAGVLKQLDESTLEVVASVIDSTRLESLILETLGVSKQRLSLAEQEHLTALIVSVLNDIRKQAGLIE